MKYLEIIEMWQEELEYLWAQGGLLSGARIFAPSIDDETGEEKEWTVSRIRYMLKNSMITQKHLETCADELLEDNREITMIPMDNYPIICFMTRS